jgi:hypothetical protein
VKEEAVNFSPFPLYFSPFPLYFSPAAVAFPLRGKVKSKEGNFFAKAKKLVPW